MPEVYALETPSGQLSTEQILSAVACLSLPELEQVFAQVLALQAARKAAHLPAGEAALLARINQGLPAALSSQQNITSVFIQGSKVDSQKLRAALNMSYENLRSLLGVRSDFCIYIEDENGYLVPMENKIGLGSPLANLSGKACNDTIS